VARILLSAYACEPGRGSEPGVGWNWATELAEIGHQVCVLTRANNRAAIERAPESGPSNLAFLYYDLPRWTQQLRRLPGGKPLYYVLWQYFAARHLRRLFPGPPPFDVVQHVTYVSARFPSFMGSLCIPFFFGPVSGGEVVPQRLRAAFSLCQRIRERIRDISNRLVALDPLMRITFGQAQRILVTPDTLALVPPAWQPKCQVRLAIGLPEHQLASCKQPKRHRPTLSLLYVGRLLEWKGVDLALRALSQVKRSHPDLTLTIVGDGPALPRLARLSEKLGLQYAVRWMGWLPHRDLLQHYQAADLLLFPSLRDSGGSVVLEALAHGVPVLCTDLGGPGLIVNHTCGRALSTRDRGPDELACAMSQTLLELLGTRGLLDSLSIGARARARQFNFQDLALSVHPAPPVRIVSRKA
jgi:glycosyltransferase involved in cell wall biosynthesis